MEATNDNEAANISVKPNFERTCWLIPWHKLTPVISRFATPCLFRSLRCCSACHKCSYCHITCLGFRKLKKRPAKINYLSAQLLSKHEYFSAIFSFNGQNEQFYLHLRERGKCRPQFLFAERTKC